MIILTIKTDNPQAEVGLFNNAQQIAHKSWQAHRQLAETLHLVIKDLTLGTNNGLDLNKLEGIVVFVGPGSFTGLRIGVSVANALSYGLGVPIVGGSGAEWCLDGVKRLLSGHYDGIVVPQYGSLPNTTQPKK